MGLNSRGGSRGHSANGSFYHKSGPAGKMVGQMPVFGPGPPDVFCSPQVACSPQVPFGGPPFFGTPPGGNFKSKPFYGKFPRKNFNRKFPPKNNEAAVIEIDLTKPWVSEEIKIEELKKKEMLEAWKLSKDDDSWILYKAQKVNVESLYENAKIEYFAHHPDEAAVWASMPHLKKLYCDTCDKSFRTDDDLIIHESEHETCGRDGCTFTAHPKVVSKHIKMQHDSGLFQRIGVIYTKEDLDKWIEERKRRYPTKKIVEEKKAMEEEKIMRGERIKEDNSRFNKSFKNRNKNEVKKKFQKRTRNRKRWQKKKKKNPLPAPTVEENLPIERRGVPAFCGIKDPSKSEPTEEEQSEKDNLDISDDEWKEESKWEDTKPVLNNSLGLLAAAYDSEEESQKKDIGIEKEKRFASDDEGSGPEEVPTVRSKSPPPPPENTNKDKVPQKRKFLDKNTRQCKRVKNNFTDKNPERSLTLLEKLLKNEIRHERNVILQCVHYVVKNNFFKT